MKRQIHAYRGHGEINVEGHNLKLGRGGIRNAYHTGRGSIVMRGRVEMETVRKEREAIVITEIPFQVNKASLVEHIADLVRDKVLTGISDIRDESSRKGVRVDELKKELQKITGGRVMRVK